MTTVRRAILSVSDKRGLVNLARGLSKLGVELLATGGTAKALTGAGLAVIDVSEVTGFPELMDGRLKTLHPKIHGAILARREDANHRQQMEEHGIEPIDLVVVNLDPFEETIAKPGCTMDEAIDNIDIGGPTLIRSAAKNHQDVAVVVDPADYDELVEELRTNERRLSPETCYRLAQKAFAHTARYDARIAEYLESVDEGPPGDPFPPRLRLEFERIQT
ncbi:MAG: bifunctional phosphoribosylaminoimidazolecarboxamide formyltransferase/IMP cyclohydrolase, partial [Vicinamibacteria bacterium]